MNRPPLAGEIASPFERQCVGHLGGCCELIPPHTIHACDPGRIVAAFATVRRWLRPTDVYERACHRGRPHQFTFRGHDSWYGGVPQPVWLCADDSCPAWAYGESGYDGVVAATPRVTTSGSDAP